MTPFTLRATTPGATRRIGARIGRLLRAGDAVLLSGELGAGKTVLAQGIARGLGVADPVKSSSFVIVNEYQGKLRGSEVRLYHADLYRLGEPEQVAELALDEMAADGVLVVEWPERAPGELPAEHLRVAIGYGVASARSIAMTGAGARYEEIVRRLATHTASRH